VILIEDEEVILGSLGLLLEREGMRVSRYPSAEPLLEDCARAPLLESASAVVTDVSLPGLDGIELALELRRKGFARPIVFITALGNPGFGRHRAALEPFRVVRKPFRARELAALLRELPAFGAGKSETELCDRLADA
jgi:FixJ family two-component response regulator